MRLQEDGMHTLLLSNPINIRYVAGVELSSGLLLIQKRKKTLYVDARYSEAAALKKKEGTIIRNIVNIDEDFSHIRRCGFEADEVTVGRLARWKKRWKKVIFIPTSGIVEKYRRKKNAEEIRLLRRAERMTKELLRRVPKELTGSPSEKSLAWRLREWAEELGAEGLAFDPIVAFGRHTSEPHHHPSEKKLGDGDLVQIDVGAKVGGYCADLSRVYFTAPPDARKRCAYTAVKAALRAVRSVIRPGVTNWEVDNAARSVLRNAQMEEYFCHAIGHGVGLEVHEGWALSKKASEEKLRKGEVYAIEPGVYFPGDFGMRIEEMVYLK